MNTRHAASLAAALCLFAGGSQAADDAGLPRCRAMAEPLARLACYDALPLRAVPAAPAVLVAPVVPPALAASMAAQNFGQERRDEPQSLSSHIHGVFEGWGPRSRITLANGQVWQVVDGSEGVYFLQNPKVTVKRALLGGFQLEIEGAQRTPRVRRVQ